MAEADRRDCAYYGNVRTTLDLPDDLYRALKVRAAREGVSLKELVARLLKKGMAGEARPLSRGRRDRPPVAVEGALPALSKEALREIAEEELLGRGRWRGGPATALELHMGSG